MLQIRSSFFQQMSIKPPKLWMQFFGGAACASSTPLGPRPADTLPGFSIGTLPCPTAFLPLNDPMTSDVKLQMKLRQFQIEVGLCAIG